MLKDNSDRWRCKTRDCNPELYGEAAAQQHRDETGHRVNRWPVRSAEGQRRAQQRNRTGYYDKYNVGAKSRANRPKIIADEQKSSAQKLAKPRTTVHDPFLALLDDRIAQLDVFGWD